jgi:hypothetical protein
MFDGSENSVSLLMPDPHIAKNAVQFIFVPQFPFGRHVHLAADSQAIKAFMHKMFGDCEISMVGGI